MADVIQNVPNPPYKSVFADSNGFLTPIWNQFFRQVFIRMGGSLALSNSQLGNNINQNLAPLQANIATLQGQVTSLQATAVAQATSITTLNSEIDDLSQGPTP